MKQKEIFLQSEADAWFVRNQEGVAARKLPDNNPLLCEILKIQGYVWEGMKVLEVGRRDGSRVAWFKII